MLDLKRYRKEKKLSQKEIGDAIGVAPSRISKFESGKERSETIIERLLEKFPDITNYKLADDQFSQVNEIQASYMSQQKLIHHLEKINDVLVKQLENMTEKMDTIDEINRKLDACLK